MQSEDVVKEKVSNYLKEVQEKIYSHTEEVQTIIRDLKDKDQISLDIEYLYMGLENIYDEIDITLRELTSEKEY